jgi:hypothetical protein
MAAGLLTGAAFSTTVGGFAITGSLGKASAASPPRVSGPQGQNQCGNQGGNGQGQSNAQCRRRLPLAALDSSIAGSLTDLNYFNLSVTNGDSDAAGAAGTETLQTNFTHLFGFTFPSCSSSPFNICAVASGSGTFTITTKVGTLSGTASAEFDGPVVSESPIPEAALATGALGLTVTSATGAFTGTTGGSLNVALQFPVVFGAKNFTGAIAG